MRTIYRGPWDDIWQAYSMMLARIARDGYDVCGPVREIYLTDERDTEDPQRYVTEITWPVARRARTAAERPHPLTFARGEGPRLPAEVPSFG